MKFRLVLTYDQNTDACNVEGIPMTGEGVVLRGLCYAALERARDAIREFDPKKNGQPQLVLPPVNGRIPGLKG